MKKILLILVLGVFLASCGEPEDPYEAFRHETASQLFHQAEDNLRQQNFGDAVKQLDALDALYPFGQYAEQGLLDSIYGFYMDEDLDSAAAAADRFIHIYPDSPHADYAWYMTGVINFQRGMTWLQKLVGVDPAARDNNHLVMAYKDLRVVVDQYPHSHYREDAIARMAYVRNALANQQVRIAQYYFEKGAYVAAINRCNTVIQTYQGAPAVKEAVKLIVKSYQKLGLPAQAAKYQKALG